MVVITVPIMASKLDKLDLSVPMRAVADEVKKHIQQRLDSGIDTQGRAFTPYSAKYAAKRAKEGRGASPVNLQRSGNMMRAIQTSFTKYSCSIFVRGSRNEAVYGAAHQDGTDRLPQRRWWGATKEKWGEVLKKLHVEISRQLRVKADTKQI